MLANPALVSSRPSGFVRVFAVGQDDKCAPGGGEDALGHAALEGEGAILAGGVQVALVPAVRVTPFRRLPGQRHGRPIPVALMVRPGAPVAGGFDFGWLDVGQ